MLKMDGFDDAFIGIARRCGQQDLPVYSKSIAIEILTKQFENDVSKDDLDEGESHREIATEYFEFNVEGAWVGEETPIIFYEMTMEEYLDAVEE